MTSTIEPHPDAPEEQRGYDKAIIAINSGGNPQGCYNTSINALNQDAFDRGWQRACVEKGAKSA